MGNKRGKAALRSAISRGGVKERVVAYALIGADYYSKVDQCPSMCLRLIFS
jgi:hypothetical protein